MRSKQTKHYRAIDRRTLTLNRDELRKGYESATKTRDWIGNIVTVGNAPEFEEINLQVALFCKERYAELRETLGASSAFCIGRCLGEQAIERNKNESEAV